MTASSTLFNTSPGRHDRYPNTYLTSLAIFVRNWLSSAAEIDQGIKLLNQVLGVYALPS